VVYIRILHQDTTVSIAIVSAKTWVAHLKPASIPHLELSATLLTAKLARAVASDLQISVYVIYGWSDSTVTLGWIRQESTRFKTFVSNCVAQIQELLPATQWKYIPITTNPADIASREMDPDSLLSSRLWWKGPPWLSQGPGTWPTSP